MMYKKNNNEITTSKEEWYFVNFMFMTSGIALGIVFTYLLTLLP